LLKSIPLVFINNNPIYKPKPGLRLVPYDLLSFPFIEPFVLAANRMLDIGTFRLRDHHLVVSYSTGSIFMFNIEHEKLFFHFKFEYSNVFFTPRYH